MPPVPAVNSYGYLDQAAQERVVKEVAEELREMFKVQYKALRDALGVKNAPAADRLARYTYRRPEVWALYQRRRPDLYKQQRSDFENLAKNARLRVAARGLSLAQQPEAVE